MTVVLAVSTAQAATISGKIVDDKNNHLPGAKINVLGSNFSTVSDLRGQFELNELPAGSYDVRVTYIGYESQTYKLTVAEDETKKLSPYVLHSNIGSMEEVVAVGYIQRGEMRSLNTQRTANRIMNSISADGIGKLPDRNAAEAVSRVTGVSIERDQGEGRFVAIRGLPSEWSSSTINGDRIPTAEQQTESRAATFDHFPTEMIEAVEVSKAITPDMEGDALGGTINFITRTAPDEQTLSINVGASYNEKADKRNGSFNFLYGDRLMDDRLGFIMNVTSWNRDWATDNYEPRRKGNGIYRLELRDYTGTRETLGINVGAEYLLDNGKIYARALHGELFDEETHYKHRLRFDKNRVELQHIRNDMESKMKGFEFGGEHDLNSKLTFDWKLSSFDVTFGYDNIPNDEDPGYLSVQFNQKNVNFENLYYTNEGGQLVEARYQDGKVVRQDNDQVVDGVTKLMAYNTIDGGNDSWNRIGTHLPSGYQANPAETYFDNIFFWKGDIQEKDKIVGSANFTYQYNNDLELKFGAKYRSKERVGRESIEIIRWTGDGPKPALSEFKLIDQPGRTEFLEEVDVDYQEIFHQVAHVDEIVKWVNENSTNLSVSKSESETLENGRALGRNFDVEETHTSVYGMASYEVSDQLSLVGGVRLTQTDSRVKGFNHSLVESGTDSDGNPIMEDKLTPTSASNDYLSVLPSIHVKYSPDELTNWRFALTRTFARPDFGDLSPGGFYFAQDNTYTIGNPGLDPTYSTNVDVLFEHFSENIGVMSAGIFYKDVKDPIFKSSYVGEFNGLDDVEFITSKNGDGAKLYGAELTFNRQLDFLPGFARHFGVNANLTLMGSEMTLEGRSDKPAIPRQADELYNLSVYYDDEIFSARLAWNHKGAYIQEHGSSPEKDSYYGDNTSLDFTSSYMITDNAMIYLEVNNLTNEPLHYFLGNEERPKQVEYYGLRGQIGFRYDFF
ncbi:TonB-dependent receptor [Marinifaba aquimaris]|uniref:TonB-dependent receptor n=1 Tax=Marinifaba aquimaris TaxID=2741323 RepID=UPI001FE4A01B|nr:TonB-dependent receptor [Marinifaba aquimaris]